MADFLYAVLDLKNSIEMDSVMWSAPEYQNLTIAVENRHNLPYNSTHDEIMQALRTDGMSHGRELDGHSEESGHRRKLGFDPAYTGGVGPVCTLLKSHPLFKGPEPLCKCGDPAGQYNGLRVHCYKYLFNFMGLDIAYGMKFSFDPCLAAQQSIMYMDFLNVFNNNYVRAFTIPNYGTTTRNILPGPAWKFEDMEKPYRMVSYANQTNYKPA